jgi:hypothetical protein
VSHYLLDYTDSTTILPEGETIRNIEKVERDRLKWALALALHVGDWPRRLGGDATDEELALDKLRARRIAHVLLQALKAWGGTGTRLPKQELTREEVATLDWEAWRNLNKIYLQRRRAYIAAWALKTHKEPWGKSALVKINNEIRQLDYALRD